MKTGEEKTKAIEDDIEGQNSGEHDDEFVSDSHQVSSKDLAEADEAMKKLGLGKVFYTLNVDFFMLRISFPSSGSFHIIQA